MFRKQAIQILAQSACEQGFLATASGNENYNRVWSRDSAITALAVFLHREESLYATVKQSICTLAAQQKENGLIPSNVGMSSSGELIVSYGTLVGRVDAQTWWIIQSCLYLKVSNDLALKSELHPKIKRTLALLEAWEFNARDLVYTPLGGNWADEYILSGYTLYDNLLRYLALHLCALLWPEHEKYQQKANLVRNAILVNFTNTAAPAAQILHPRIKTEWDAAAHPFLPAAFDAAQYLPYFDAAANGLALLLGFENNSLPNYVHDFLADPAVGFVPAFWPVITPDIPAWQLLRNQYNYNFKNTPYQFHNGGSWPVMSGVLSMGLRFCASANLADQMKESYERFLAQTDHFDFSEYISVNDQQPGGKKDMCFSASGYLFLCAEYQQIKSLLAL
jgi:hypothetical protein